MRETFLGTSHSDMYPTISLSTWLEPKPLANTFSCDVFRMLLGFTLTRRLYTQVRNGDSKLGRITAEATFFDIGRHSVIRPILP